MKPPPLLPRAVVEAIGAFAIVFFGCGAAATLNADSGGHLATNLVFGLTVAVFIYGFGNVSGAHFNPVVTLTRLTYSKMPLADGAAYMAAQFTGAIAASFLHSTPLIPKTGMEPPRADFSFGATVPTIGPAAAIGLEIVLTFGLLMTILRFDNRPKGEAPLAGLIIGSYVTLAGLFAGPLTGNSMNPARSLGPALFAGDKALASIGIYFAGPVIGALIAGGLQRWLLTFEAPGPPDPQLAGKSE